MPRITFTTPPVANHFKIGGFTVYTQNGHYYAKRNSGKGIVKFYDLGLPNLSFLLSAALWPFATLDQIQHWIAYKNNEGIQKSARNAFVKNNLQAIHHYLPGIDPIMDISLPAVYPEYPTCFYAYYDEDNDTIVYEWNDIYIDETYIALGLLNITSRTNKLTPKYRIKNAALAADLSEYLPGSIFSAGAKLWASIRACNERGEVSPWCPGIEIDVPKKPKPDFYAIPTEGSKPLTVQFYDQSTGFIRGRLWDFGDGYQSGATDPDHVFNSNPDWYTISLTCFGAGGSKKSKIRKDYIHAEEEELVKYLFIIDRSNYRAAKWRVADKSALAVYGSPGSGDGQFVYPMDIFAYDNTEIFVSDMSNNRIQVFLLPSFTFSRKIGSYGTGNDQFKYPNGIFVDNQYLFIADEFNNRVHIRDKSSLSLVSMINRITSGDYAWGYPMGVCADSNYIWITALTGHKVLIYDRSTLTCIGKIDTSNAVGWTPWYMPRITCDDTFIYLSNYYSANSDLVILPKFSTTPYKKINCGGAMADPYVRGIALDLPIIYMTDYPNKRVIFIDINSETIIDSFGSEGTGIDQFKLPMGIALVSW